MTEAQSLREQNIRHGVRQLSVMKTLHSITNKQECTASEPSLIAEPHWHTVVTDGVMGIE